MHDLTIYIAKYLIVIPILVTVVLWARRKNWHDRIVMGATILGGGLLTWLLAKFAGHFFYDTRPFVVGHFSPWISHVPDNGFPSDHTLLAAFLAYVAFSYSRRFGILLLLCAAGIGAARVAAGVHHVTDIVGSFVIAGIGFLLGRVLVEMGAALYSRLRPKAQSSIE